MCFHLFLLLVSILIVKNNTKNNNIQIELEHNQIGVANHLIILLVFCFRVNQEKCMDLGLWSVFFHVVKLSVRLRNCTDLEYIYK